MSWFSRFFKKRKSPPLVITIREPLKAGANPRTLKYKTFDGKEVILSVWVGRDVALGTKIQLDFETAKFILDYLDTAHLWYSESTGRTPTTSVCMVDGRVLIAEADSTCGAGCGYIGTYGIEILTAFMQGLITEAKRKEVNQIPLYELGRNFWHFTDKATYVQPDDTGSVTTGFAVLNRCEIARVHNLNMSSISGTSWFEFQKELKELAGTYIQGSEYNWNNTLKVGKGVPNDLGLGATDLFASIVLHLQDKFNPNLTRDVWRKMDALGNRTSTQDAVDNLVIAVSHSCKKNLSVYFETTLKFPVSSKAKSIINSAYSS